MAFDGIFLNAVANELKQIALFSKVDKIYQPEKDELILQIRGYGKSYNLLLCVNPSSSRIHFTSKVKENPITPPMFCMLLRKHLVGAKISNIVQIGFERALDIVFDGFNEFSEPSNKHLIIEIMGRYSNIILTDENYKILDCVKRVDITVSSQRQVLPGLQYEQPPAQNKLLITDIDETKINVLLGENSTQKLDKLLWMVVTYII